MFNVIIAGLIATAVLARIVVKPQINELLRQHNTNRRFARD